MLTQVCSGMCDATTSTGLSHAQAEATKGITIRPAWE
jgi:hypothetical protein